MAAFTTAPTRMWLEGPAFRPYRPPRRPSQTLARVRSIAHARPMREVALVVAAYFIYFLVRGFTEGSHDQAVSNSEAIVGLERAGGFFWEPAIQSAIVDQHWIVTLANWMYIWGHWPLIAGVAAWLLVRRPAGFSLFRNAFFISGAIGVVVFVLFPVAPPRLMSEIGVIDTVTQHSNAYRVLQPPAFTNQYAAVPSLHFGWDLLIGLALITQSRWTIVKVVGAIVPVLMLSAIVLTANHYIFDAIAGGLVAMTGLAAAVALSRLATRAKEQPETETASAPAGLPAAA